MRRRLVGHLTLVVLLAAAGTSCRRRHRVNTVNTIQYVPSAAPQPGYAPQPAYRASVYLQVLDQRPPDRGGLDTRRVGRVRGKYGIPKPVLVTENTVSRNVWTATSDALGQLAIGASAGPKKLVATVLEFWDDSLGGSGSHVIVRYQLLDPSGQERWTATIEGGSSARGDPSVPSMPHLEDRSLGTFTYALAVLSARARAAFASPEFQQAIGP